jgi:hypothetical protein
VGAHLEHARRLRLKDPVLVWEGGARVPSWTCKRVVIGGSGTELDSDSTGLGGHNTYRRYSCEVKQDGERDAFAGAWCRSLHLELH